jgi:type IX secretion system PorP/SprF family membrane protein
LNRIGFFSLLLFCSFFGRAQDIHWSQFNDNPIFQNPGNAGHFNGDVRFIANYRDQWRSVTVPFQTMNFSVDAKPLKRRDIGYGLMVFHDVVGDGNFRTIEIQGNISKVIKLTSDSTHVLRPGINIGMNHRQLNFDKFYFDNQFNGVQFFPSLPTGEVLFSDSRTNLNVGLGTVYEYYKDPRFNFTSGIGVFNVNRPNQGFYGDVIRRDVRFTFFGKGLFKLNYDWDLVPGLQVSVQGKYREIMIGSSAKYTLVNRLGEYRAFYAGLFYRNQDAVFLSAGMDYQSWFFGVSYDINFSQLVPASRARGGFEIAIRYIMNRFKPKKISHRICPDYI